MIRANRLEGTIEPPGDKSISHRAAILNAIAHGTGRITNYSPGVDCNTTVRCLADLGIDIERNTENPSELTIKGRSGEMDKPVDVLDAQNSGTTMRLLSGLLAAQPFMSTLTGDASLLSRPMERIVTPLRQMGALVDGRSGGEFAPLVFHGGSLTGIDYTLPVASAQIKSCLLLAGLFAKGDTVLHQPAISRDHTERMLTAMGGRISAEGKTLSLHPTALRAVDVRVPADLSSAAFWLIAGLLHPEAEIRIDGVGLNPTRTGIFSALEAMGAQLEIVQPREEGGEPVADIIARSSTLRGTDISGNLIPLLLDEIPVLAVAACFAEGQTTIRDASELRVKESDRISTTVQELSRLGARIQELPDGLVIQGPVRLRGTRCNSHGDHRLAMALAIAGLLADSETIIEGSECVDISYPGFWEHLRLITGEGA